MFPADLLPSLASANESSSEELQRLIPIRTHWISVEKYLESEGVSIKSVLGIGDWGIAFLASDGGVVKITTSRDEAICAQFFATQQETDEDCRKAIAKFLAPVRQIGNSEWEPGKKPWAIFGYRLERLMVLNRDNFASKTDAQGNVTKHLVSEVRDAAHLFWHALDLVKRHPGEKRHKAEAADAVKLYKKRLALLAKMPQFHNIAVYFSKLASGHKPRVAWDLKPDNMGEDVQGNVKAFDQVLLPRPEEFEYSIRFFELKGDFSPRVVNPLSGIPSPRRSEILEAVKEKAAQTVEAVKEKVSDLKLKAAREAVSYSIGPVGTVKTFQEVAESGQLSDDEVKELAEFCLSHLREVFEAKGYLR